MPSPVTRIRKDARRLLLLNPFQSELLPVHLAQRHIPLDKCPVAYSKCKCGHHGPGQQSVLPSCPCANVVAVHDPDQWCGVLKEAATQDDSNTDKVLPPPSSGKPQASQVQLSSRRVCLSCLHAQAFLLLISYGAVTSHIQMLPDTGADVSPLGPQHFDLLEIPQSSLNLPPTTTTLTVDSSVVAPGLSPFMSILIGQTLIFKYYTGPQQSRCQG